MTDDGTHRSNQWDETTPHETATGKEKLDQAWRDARYVRRRIDEVDGTVGEMMGEVGRYRQDAEKAHAKLELKVDGLDDRVTRGFERIGGVLDSLGAKLDEVMRVSTGAMRKAEDSSNDLSEFGRELEKAKKYMKWPTAIVCIVGLAGYAFLTYTNALPAEISKSVTTFVVGMLALAASAMPALFPSLVDWVRVRLGLAPKPPTGSAS